MKGLITLLFLLGISTLISAQCPDEADFDLSSNIIDISVTCVLNMPSDVLTNAQITIQETGSLTINFSGGSTYIQDGGSITVFGDGTPQDGLLAINGNFSILNSFGSDPSLTIQNGAVLNVTGNMIAGATPVVLTPVTFNINGTAIIGNDLTMGDQSTLTGSGSINVTNNITDNGTDDSGFINGSVSCGGLSCDPLPVEFLFFTADLEDNKVILDWSTGSEVNNKGFEVERSLNGIDFEVIGFELGIGNSTKINNYIYVDHNPPLTQTVYYRLKQGDYDGSFSFSDIVDVEMISLTNELKLYPSVIDDRITIEGNPALQYTFVLSNLSGSQVIKQSQQIDLSTLNGILNQSLSNLNDGLYIISVHDGNQRQSLKFVKI